MINPANVVIYRRGANPRSWKEVTYAGDPECVYGMRVLRWGQKERGEEGCGLERQTSKHRLCSEAEKCMGFPRQRTGSRDDIKTHLILLVSLSPGFLCFLPASPLTSCALVNSFQMNLGVVRGSGL